MPHQGKARVGPFPDTVVSVYPNLTYHCSSVASMPGVDEKLPVCCCCEQTWDFYSWEGFLDQQLRGKGFPIGDSVQ